MSTGEGTGQVVTLEEGPSGLKSEWLADKVSAMWLGYYLSDERRVWLDEVDEVKKFLYATDTRSTSNSVNPASHSTHMPKLSQIADTLEAHYTSSWFPHPDWLQFVAGGINDNKPRVKRIIESYIRSRHRLVNHSDTFNALSRDWVETGNAFCETIWKSETASEIDGLLRKAFIGPVTRRIDPKRIAFNYRASSFHESWKVIQSVKTLGDIAADIQDEKLPESYREILTRSMDFRSWARSTPYEDYQEFFDSPFDGFGNQYGYWASGDSVELLTFYGSLYDPNTQMLKRNKKIVVIDRRWILTEEDINTWDGSPLIYHSTWRQKPGTLLGMGPCQNLTGMQYMINHLQNTKADAFDKMVMPDKLLQNIEDMQQQADGTKWWIATDSGRVTNIAPDTTILSADFQIDALERKMDSYAAVPPESYGFKTPGEQTKFQVSERVNAAGLMFLSKIAKFESQLISPSVNAELELAKDTSGY